MQTPRDFQWLEERIFKEIHETLSASTLMRLWGYRSGGVPRQTTLDVLARYVGFEDYVGFCKQNSPSTPSKPPRGEASYPSPSGETEGAAGCFGLFCFCWQLREDMLCGISRSTRLWKRACLLVQKI